MSVHIWYSVASGAELNTVPIRAHFFHQEDGKKQNFKNLTIFTEVRDIVKIYKSSSYKPITTNLILETLHAPLSSFDDKFVLSVEEGADIVKF